MSKNRKKIIANTTPYNLSQNDEVRKKRKKNTLTRRGYGLADQLKRNGIGAREPDIERSQNTAVTDGGKTGSGLKSDIIPRD